MDLISGFGFGAVMNDVNKLLYELMSTNAVRLHEAMTIRMVNL